MRFSTPQLLLLLVVFAGTTASPIPVPNHPRLISTRDNYNQPSGIDVTVFNGPDCTGYSKSFTNIPWGVALQPGWQNADDGSITSQFSSFMLTGTGLTGQERVQYWVGDAQTSYGNKFGLQAGQCTSTTDIPTNRVLPMDVFDVYSP